MLEVLSSVFIENQYPSLGFVFHGTKNYASNSVWTILLLKTNFYILHDLCRLVCYSSIEFVSVEIYIF